ncbi:MAG: di-trans,poly-cis-decaprenylcistransferase [Gammaproteobacteria bacterium]|nr:di-trans,poly-cis-decaprenylcistransferase [Gammaproteobacteria bacterium]
MSLPQHVAIIMDGNGRWARARGASRNAGHAAGIAAVRAVIEQCLQRGIPLLTLFAFSSENWGRPPEEVRGIMELFLSALAQEIDELRRNGVRLRFIGERATLAPQLQQRMQEAEQATGANSALTLLIAVSYGGRSDIVRAARRLAERVTRGELAAAACDEAEFARGLELAGVADPDLFIRTGGERRISNFLLWNLAYTELHFSDVLWPDFDAAAFDAALRDFSGRERRFGLAPAPVDAP